MLVVAALGGNALARRGELITVENQRRNVRRAVAALRAIADEHSLVITFGNGPQVGLLAMQQAVASEEQRYPLDVLGAESEGLIGYLIELELASQLPDRRVATLLTQVEVDRADPAFMNPTKPVGPVCTHSQAMRMMRQYGWSMSREGEHYRRVVPSPKPLRIRELHAIDLLVRDGVVVVCAGGGGVPTTRDDDGSVNGVEAVIDKDRASALLAIQLSADALLLLTDVEAVYSDWGQANARPIRRTTPDRLLEQKFEQGSMQPKVEAAAEFVAKTGAVAAIGALDQSVQLLNGSAGTIVRRDSAQF